MRHAKQLRFPGFGTNFVLPTAEPCLDIQRRIYDDAGNLSNMLNLGFWIPLKPDHQKLNLKDLHIHSKELPALIQHLLEQSKNNKAYIFRNIDFKNNCLRRITHLARLNQPGYQLKTLDLSYNLIENIKPLEYLTSLTELNLSYNHIMDFEPLKNLTSLEYLDISANQTLDDCNIDFLSSLTFLKTLGCWNVVRDASPITALTNLEKLTLFSGTLDDLSFLKELPKLKSLQTCMLKTEHPRWYTGDALTAFIESNGQER